MNDNIKAMRMFFKITVAAFNMQDSVISAVGHNPAPNKMRILHLMALDELEKETPDMQMVDILLQQMEILAEENKTNS